MRSWALIVGIDDYPVQSGQRPLQGAVYDASRFAEWALDPSRGNLPWENVYFWCKPAPQAGIDSGFANLQAYLNPPAGPASYPPKWFDSATGLPQPADFTRAPDFNAIVQTAVDIKEDAQTETYEGNTEKKRCWVYFAGHGVQTTSAQRIADLQTCFVVGDFRPTLVNTQGLIPCVDLRIALATSGFDEVIMVLDCCRVGGSAFDGVAPLIRSVQTGSNVWVMALATQHGGVAHETTEIPISGAFSSVFMDALDTCRNPAGDLTVDVLRPYLSQSISRYTDQVQRPDISSVNNDGTIVIIPNSVIPPPPGAAPVPVLAGLNASAQDLINVAINFGKLPDVATIQIVDGKGMPVGDLIYATGEGTTVNLESGKLFALDISMPGQSPRRSDPFDLSSLGNANAINL